MKEREKQHTKGYQIMTTKNQLIGLMGAAGSGKDTVGEHLAVNYDYIPTAIAYAIKAMLHPLFEAVGLEEEFWEIAEDRVKKEQPIPQLGGKSFRRLAQTLGTEWGRNCVGDGIWCDIVLDRVKARQHIWPYVITDVRFENEVQGILEAGGVIWKIERPGIESVSAHVSESFAKVYCPDVIIQNDGTLEELYSKVDALMKERK